MYSFGLRPLITKPTRLTEFTTTLIDNIFTNEWETNIESGILINDITDHLPVFCVCKYVVEPVTKEVFVLKRDIKENNVNEFVESIDNIDWSEILAQEDVNTVYNGFVDKIKTAYDKHCPIRRVKVSKKMNKKTLVNKQFTECN